MAAWHIHHGKWWMLQWAFDGWLSFGLHLDCRRRKTARAGIPYGPYLDLHFGVAIVSVGVNPVYSGDLAADCSFSRGGQRASDH